MNFIDERNERTRKRKKAKAAFDKAINLSVLNEKNKTYNLSANMGEDTVRLLDEGAIVTADGNLDIYIMRGAIEKYLNGANTKIKGANGELMNLTDEYEGSINIGHLPFAEFPVGIVGSWTKSDFSVVDIGDDRKGLDVDLQVNPEHPLMKALEVQGIPVGVSVEMYLHFDEDASEEQGAPMVDEIFISDFAIVGECGNVGSSDTVVLQGVEMDEEKTVEAVEEETPEEETVEVEETEEAEEAEAEETEAEETEVETEEESEEDTEEDVEEESTDEADSESESEEDADEEDSSNEVLEALDSMKKQIESLNEQIDALKKTNRKLNKKLKAKNEADEKFMEKFKGLSISLGEQKEEEKEVTFTPYATGDGKGVL